MTLDADPKRGRLNPDRRRREPLRARPDAQPPADDDLTTLPGEGYGGGNDDTVELGSSSGVSEGEALAVRRAAERQHGDTGIPIVDSAGALPPDEPEAVDPFTRLARLAREYLSLRETPYGLGPVVVLALISFFGRFDAAAYNVARPFIVRDLEVDIQSIIEISSYIGVVAAFATVGAGWLLDRHKRTPWVVAGTVTGGLLSAAASRATSLFTLGLPRLMGEVSDIAGGVPRFSLLADYYPPESRGRVFAFLSTLANVGSLGAILVVGVAIDAWGWRTALLVFAIPYTVMGFVALLRLREPIRGYMERRALGADEALARVEDEPQSFGEAWRTTFAVRTLRRLFIADGFSVAGASMVGLFLPFYLVEQYNLNATELSLISLPNVLAAIIGGFYGGHLVDRFTRRNPGRVLTIIGVFSLISSVGVFGYIFTPPLIVLILMNTIFGLGFALIGPASAVVYTQVIPSSIRTQGVQVTELARLPALMIGVPIATTLFGSYGYDAVFTFALPLLLLGGVIAMTAGGFFDLDVRSAFAANLANEEWRRAKTSGKGKLLVCRDIDVSYSGVQVLFGVDFDVEEGEIIALLGTNGAGKSTLLRAISGTTEAAGGAVVFDGRDITHMPPHEIAARGVIHMPGGRGVFPGLSVRDNLMLANWMTDDAEEIRSRMAETFEIFPVLRERADTVAANLSGGEQQQLSLAQAFLAKPRLLMIDELSLGLSPAVVADLLDVVRRIHERGVTIIVVEQSVNVALTIAQKAIFMEKGEVKFFGRTADLLERPDILRAVYVKGSGALAEGAPAAARRSDREQRSMDLDVARPILEVDGLVKRYGGVTAVDGVSFALRDGEVLGLIGPNGAGKTTVLEMISGYQIPDEGKVLFEGVDITSETPEARARRRLIRRFQDARLFPALTVFETLLVALEQRLEVKSALLNAMAMPQARRAERRLRIRAERIVELLELGSYRDKFVKELSTGLRRIVDLACVIATEPRVLLLDEPSSGIAQAEAESLGPLLRRIRFETGCSIIIIEHDMPLISAVSDELLALERGRVLTRGTPTEVLNNERVIESYLGTTEATVKRSGRVEI